MADLNYNTIAREVHQLQGSVDSLTRNGLSSDETILSAIASTDPDQLEVSKIPSTWANLAKVDNDIEIRPAGARVLTALSLKAHSDMWAWFSRHVTEPILYLLEIPIERQQHRSVQARMPNSWIFRLFQRVQLSLMVHADIKLLAAEFFKGLDAPDYTCPYGRESRALFHIEAAVSSWLSFHPRPGMSLITSRAVATFISAASTAFKSADFLYLSHIQDGVKHLRASLTNERIPLTRIPWGRLTEELKEHPLASPNSNEAIAVKRLRNVLWAVSGLPTSDPSLTKMAEQYREATKMGGGGTTTLINAVGLPRAM